jgi:hypothetical protein
MIFEGLAFSFLRVDEASNEAARVHRSAWRRGGVAASGQLGSEHWQAAIVAACPAILDVYVPTVDKAALFQTRSQDLQMMDMLLPLGIDKGKDLRLMSRPWPD